MSLSKSEFTADLLISVLVNEPELPLYMGFFVSEVNGNKEPLLQTSEVADPAYLRQRVNFTPIVDGFVRLLHDIQYPRVTKRWERVTHFGILDALHGGNLLLLKPTGGVSDVEPSDIIAVLNIEFQLYVGMNQLLYGDVA